MHTQLKSLFLKSEIILIAISSIAQLVLMRLDLNADLLLSTLIVVSIVGLPESVLIGGFLGYLLLFGPLPRVELAYLLAVPILVGYFGRRLFGANIATLCGLTILGMILFYGLIDLQTLVILPGRWIWNILISILWVVGLYYYWVSKNRKQARF
jgi:hypothetical protein